MATHGSDSSRLHVTCASFVRNLMKPMKQSVALTCAIHELLLRHLLRQDGQEDLCFGLWSPSLGAERQTALVRKVLLPGDGERNVHANVSFEPEYFLRALREAQENNCGIALLHSHPRGTGWQELSEDDAAAEEDHARQSQVVTGLP